MDFQAFRRHSLKTRILIVTLGLIVAAVWSLSFYASRLLRDGIVHLLGEQQRSTIAFVAKEIDNDISNRIRALELTAANLEPALLSRHEALQQRLEQHLVLQSMFNIGTWVTDAEGTTIGVVPRSIGNLGVSYRDREYFTRTIRDNRPTVSSPLIGKVIQTPIIVIAVPLRDAHGKPIGALCGGTRLDQASFFDPITENRYGKTGGFLVISPETRQIIKATDSRRNMEVLAPRGVNPSTDRGLEHPPMTQIQKNARGVEILVSSHAIPSAGWVAAALLTTEEAFAPINDIHRGILLAAALVTALAGSVMWWLLNRQLRPLGEAARALDVIRESGAAPHPLPLTRNDEIGILITAFNESLGQLQQREQALRESEQRFRALHDGSFGGIAIHDKGAILDCNQALADMSGFSHEELIGMDGLQLIAPAWRDRVRNNIKNGYDRPYDAEGLRKDGSVYPLAIRGKNIPYKGNTVRVTEFRDISEQKQAEQQLRIAATAFESSEGMFITDAEHRFVRANRAFLQMVGYSFDELQPHRPAIIHSERNPPELVADLLDSLDRDGAWRGEFWARRKNGEDFPTRLSVTAVRDEAGGTTHYVSGIEDITERKLAEEEIRHLAYFDQLTGLPNRQLLTDRLQQALAASGRHHRCGAVLFVDLDNFKTLNDTLGHEQGDILLRQVAQRLSRCVRECDTVARQGGDEFVIMLEALGETLADAANHAERVGDKIIASLNQPYHFPGYEHHSSASIGIAMFSGCDDVADELLKRADMAMYQAKSAGRNTLRFFDPEMQAVVSARAALEAGLREALQRAHFVLHFQPQVDSAGRLRGAEVLLRWHDPRYAQVPARIFISVAEETGLIIPIGEWVLSTVCAQLVAWQADPALAHLSIAVNISPRQFQQKDFVERLLATIERSGADPRRLKLELTEGILVKDIDDVVAKMGALKVHGIGFSLDDFGTGYSSLSYLKRLPLDQLKIDQGFVRDILADADDAAIAGMVVALGENFGLTVIAEGVETEAQLFKLAELGCNHYQGYLFSRPLPQADFEAYARRQTRR